MNFPLRAWQELLAGMRLPRSKRRSKSKRKADRVWVESLEPRQLLTVQPPSLSYVSLQSITQGAPLSVPISAQYGSGAPQQSLTYSLFQAPAGVSLSSPGGQETLIWNTVGVAAGTYDATVKVIENSDPALSATETFQIQVADAQPSLTLPSNIPTTANVGQEVTFQATATDPGANPGLGRRRGGNADV